MGNNHCSWFFIVQPSFWYKKLCCTVPNVKITSEKWKNTKAFCSAQPIDSLILMIMAVKLCNIFWQTTAQGRKTAAIKNIPWNMWWEWNIPKTGGNLIQGQAVLSTAKVKSKQKMNKSTNLLVLLMSPHWTKLSKLRSRAIGETIWDG